MMMMMMMMACLRYMLLLVFGYLSVNPHADSELREMLFATCKKNEA